jgi:hypothetical protein
LAADAATCEISFSQVFAGKTGSFLWVPAAIDEQERLDFARAAGEMDGRMSSVLAADDEVTGKLLLLILRGDEHGKLSFTLTEGLGDEGSFILSPVDVSAPAGGKSFAIG